MSELILVDAPFRTMQALYGNPPFVPPPDETIGMSAPICTPSRSVDVIKSAIVEFYAQYDITLSESSASISYHNSSTSFSFSTAFNMHSTIGSTANQHAMNVFRDSFRREVNVGGEKYRVVVWVYN